jgi:hypothetical protein
LISDSLSSLTAADVMDSVVVEAADVAAVTDNVAEAMDHSVAAVEMDLEVDVAVEMVTVEVLVVGHAVGDLGQSIPMIPMRSLASDLHRFLKPG